MNGPLIETTHKTTRKKRAYNHSTEWVCFVYSDARAGWVVGYAGAGKDDNNTETIMRGPHVDVIWLKVNARICKSRGEPPQTHTHTHAGSR